jgi:hypothetical protein
MLERWLVSILTSNTAVTAMVQSGSRARIFPLIVPQKKKLVEQMPCVVYTVSSEDRQKTYCGTQKLLNAAIQLDHYALTLEEARRLSFAVRAVLIDFIGSDDSIVVRDVALTGSFATYDMDPGLMRVVDTYTIWYEEE